MRYVDTMITMSEIPDEISLCINIPGCNIHCKHCHSKYLWDDKVDTPEDKSKELTLSVLDNLIKENDGISCVCFFGGESYIKALVSHVKCKYPKLKVAWYTGNDLWWAIDFLKGGMPDYLKVGSYISKLGGLANKNTNQRMYEIKKIDTESDDKKELVFNDITYKFWR